jgi:hypothetical protein
VTEPTKPSWKKSSFSLSGDCVAWSFRDGGVRIGDTKHPDGPTLFFTLPEWQAFLKGVHHGEAAPPEA